MSSPVKTKRVQFDENTIATHQVVAGVSGETIKIKALHLYSVGVNETTIQSAATPLAAYPLIAQDQINLHMVDGADRYFETVAGEDFAIQLGAALRVTGFVVFEQS